MGQLVIHAARVLTPVEEICDAAVLVEDHKIVAVGRREEFTVPRGAREWDARGLTLTPGFVDVHIHGAGGHDVMEGEPDALRAVARTVARYGTTSLLATTVTAELDATCRSLEAIARFISSDDPSRSGAQYLGIHFEGPFLSHARRGVQPAEWIIPPNAAAFSRLLTAASGQARILTLAPEVDGALEIIQAACTSGLVVAVGHTDATYAQAMAGINAGARHAVHVFNAMRPLAHRETGVIGAVLTDARVTCELIADNVHVDPPAMKILLRAKGPAGVILVSDAISATGMPDGDYRLGTFQVTVAGGICRDARGHLAGSTLTLDRALRNAVALGVPLADAVRMVTLNPAKLLGLERSKGTVAPGADADLVLLDDSLHVRGVLLRGTPLNQD